MLKSTFCHLPGISVTVERKLWDNGIQCWEAAIEIGGLQLPRKRISSLSTRLNQSFESLRTNDPNYFTTLLPGNQHWRLYPDFRQSLAYLDIETTGLGYRDSITTIVIYDGQSIKHYVRSQNLNEFKQEIEKYSVVVTYNGKCFDVPFIERQFGIRMNQAHIDLRHVLKSLGYAGGLKGCERQLGLDRKELRDVDGYMAVLLWDEFKKYDNPRALETLLAYNTYDVVNLETLMVIAYNLKLKATPFHTTHRLSEPAAPAIPFKADVETIERVRRRSSSFALGGYYANRR